MKYSILLLLIPLLSAATITVVDQPIKIEGSSKQLEVPSSQTVQPINQLIENYVIKSVPLSQLVLEETKQPQYLNPIGFSEENMNIANQYRQDNLHYPNSRPPHHHRDHTNPDWKNQRGHNHPHRRHQHHGHRRTQNNLQQSSSCGQSFELEFMSEDDRFLLLQIMFATMLPIAFICSCCCLCCFCCKKIHNKNRMCQQRRPFQVSNPADRQAILQQCQYHEQQVRRLSDMLAVLLEERNRQIQSRQFLPYINQQQEMQQPIMYHQPNEQIWDVNQEGSRRFRGYQR